VIHAEEVGSEDCRFVTASACADFDNRRAVVERVVRNERRLDERLELRNSVFDAGDFGARFVGHFRVINRNELACLRELVLESLELSGHFDERAKVAVLATQRGHALGVLYGLRIGKLALDLGGAG
jgi:hypothetical protein